MSIAHKSPNILVVDDNSGNLDLLCRILAKANFKTITAVDGVDALAKIDCVLPQLILLDVMMPKLDGFETCKILRENPITCQVPIIFMTALTELEQKIKGFQLGGNDYITKPFHKAELLARVKTQLRSLNFQQILEKQNWILQQQIKNKQEAELSLLETNDRLALTNQFLEREIKHSKAMALQLQQEIEQKYEAELSLLETNEHLAATNQSLEREIKHSKAMALRLQQEILERQQAEQEVKQSLKEKDLLLKEIHHRVKNNLFIVSSLLESQADYLDDPQILKILENSQNRIMSMALIHEQLHSNSDNENVDSLCKIDFQKYLFTLTRQLIDSIFTKDIKFEAEIQQVYLNIETVQPCGLIVNELMSNAIEHAFPKTNTGNIYLQFTQDSSGNCLLLIKDNGIGFPPEKDFFQTESLGLELVTTLVQQLEGTIEMNNHQGTEIKIRFRELDYIMRI